MKTYDGVSCHVKDNVLSDLDAAGKPSLDAEDRVEDQRKVDRLGPSEISFVATQNYFVRKITFIFVCVERNVSFIF